MYDFITTYEVSRPVEIIEDPDPVYDGPVIGDGVGDDPISRLFAAIASFAVVLGTGIIFAVILYLFMGIY